MIYSIIFSKSGREFGRTSWDAGLDSAKKHAETHMKIQGADRVEVRDENGVLVFQMPRTLRAG